MDKKRLKIALSVLNVVKVKFPETQDFISSTWKEECEKERMTADEVIFYKFESIKLVWINIFVLDLVLKCLFFLFIDMKCVTDHKKTKRLSKEEIKTKLLDSMTIDEIVEFDNLNKEAEDTQDPEEAAKIFKRYEDIIKTKNKRIINVAYHQGQVFKRFKEK